MTGWVRQWTALLFEDCTSLSPPYPTRHIPPPLPCQTLLLMGIQFHAHSQEGVVRGTALTPAQDHEWLSLVPWGTSIIPQRRACWPLEIMTHTKIIFVLYPLGNCRGLGINTQSLEKKPSDFLYVIQNKIQYIRKDTYETIIKHLLSLMRSMSLFSSMSITATNQGFARNGYNGYTRHLI